MEIKAHITKFLRVLFVLVILSLFICSPLPASSDAFDCTSGKHDYAITTIAPTEENDGETIYICRLCGFRYSRILPATGHSWSEWIIDKQPTCTEPGHRHRFCTRYQNDPHTEGQAIPAIGHKYTETILPPSCGKSGKKTYTCTHCGHTYSEPLGVASAHHYIESVIKEPGCEHDGEKLFACETCEDSYTEIIPALGHSFGEWVVDKEPTEHEEGHRYKICRHDSSFIIEETLCKLTAVQAAQEKSNDEAQPFPNAADVALFTIVVLLAVFYGMPIYRNIHILRRDKKKTMPLREWLKKHHYD